MFGLNYENLIDPMLRDLRVYLPEFGGFKAGDRVLDVCCGTGAQAIVYARIGVIVTGIDLDPAMIKTAEEKKRKSGLTNVSFRVADAAHLPFDDGVFDAASIFLALHEKRADVREKVVSEMKRVVKRGGTLLFVDFRAPMPGNSYTRITTAIEFIAGREHFRNSRDFLRSGGLCPILERHDVAPEKISYLMRDNLMLVKARNEKF